MNQKLEGFDPCETKQLSVEEQVDYVINQAIDLNNLALLYEGYIIYFIH